MSRTLTIALGVLLFHLGALWALQTGLLHRMVEMVVPAEILVEIMAPAPAPAPPSPPVRRQPSPPRPVPPAPQKTAVVAPAPVPLAVADTQPVTPSAIVPAPVNVAASAASANATGTTGPAQATLAPPPVAKVESPSSDADYLNNPKPPYPALSKRLAEQGKVVVRTFIGTDGVAQKAEIKQSSGFDRLDQAAMKTVLRWRYVPGKRGGVAEAMWFNVPIHFVLE